MSEQRLDAIVIGAGMSGLAAAIRLAQFDKRVLVLEQHSLPGGLNSYYKRRGRRLDTGLHALTNFARKGARDAPLTKILRQLRISHDELALGEQSFSRISFPSRSLVFSNEFALFESEIQRVFPQERQRFAELVTRIRQEDPFQASAPALSARSMLESLDLAHELIETLMLPLCTYGSAIENDLEWNDFVILFRSVFLEGFARPEGGIKRLLDLLTARLASQGGELRRNSTVQAILIGPSGVRGVRLEDGTEWEAPHVLSSAGWVETARLAGLHTGPDARGWVSLFESMWILKAPCRTLGMPETVHFYCNHERMPWSMPQNLVEERSGVLCASDNYACTQAPTEGLLRATTIANHDQWCALEEPDYVAAKARCSDQLAQQAARLGIDPRSHSIDADSFTPRTIRRYTAHERGAVYGSPIKHRDGRTPISGLYLIGNDQGLVGITGSLLSGITMANQHLLYALQP